uniref:Uncharacterized protein n=1 Tax=Arundo donax TaxID=35708 RepID=A0A0A9A640_ARUDO
MSSTSRRVSMECAI